MKGYMLTHGDCEFQHDSSEYLVGYTHDVISGKSWVTDIADLTTEEELKNTPRWEVILPHATAAMEADITKRSEEASERAFEIYHSGAPTLADRERQELRAAGRGHLT